jgi:cation:H+ antiporter
VVSLISTNTGVDDLALSNIAGANITNITLILGITGIINTLTVNNKSTRREIKFLVLSGVVFMTLAFIGQSISRWDSIILLVLFGFFNFSCCIVDFFKEPPPCRKEKRTNRSKKKRYMRTPVYADILLLFFGIVILSYGGNVTVETAKEMAIIFNIQTSIIGATIVALGTTLPELFTSVIAALKGKADLSIGNVIGSCLFNMLAIVGINGLIHPIDVSPSLLQLHFPVMIASSIIVIPMINKDFHISRYEAFILIACYFLYVFTLIHSLQ